MSKVGIMKWLDEGMKEFWGTLAIRLWPCGLGRRCVVRKHGILDTLSHSKKNLRICDCLRPRLCSHG